VSLLYRGVSLQHCFANVDLGERSCHMLTSDKNGHGRIHFQWVSSCRVDSRKMALVRDVGDNDNSNSVQRTHF
jgi:hypothetical protein